MKRRPRRVVLLLLLLVAGGAIVNVAVAWGCVYCWSGDRGWDEVAVWQDQGMTRVAIADRTLGFSTIWGFQSRNDWSLNMFPRPSEIAREDLPSWSFAREDLIWDNTLDVWRVRDDAAGWPLPALRCRFVGPRLELGETARWGIPISAVAPLFQTVPIVVNRAFPLRPIWPGFAINTVFYAGVLWLLFAAPFALRKRRRIKRGLCPKCAYPVGTSDVCTECGTTLSQKVETSTRPNVQIMND